MRHDEHKGSRPFHCLRNIGNGDNILRELDVGEVFLVDMGRIDDLRELLPFKL